MSDAAFRTVPLALLVAIGVGSIAYALATGEPASEAPSTPIAEGDQLDQLRASADDILSTILAQESKKDATCWSSVRMIEGFSLGRQMTPTAEVARIEVTRALLERVWRRASAESAGTTLLSAEAITAATPSEVQKAKDAMDIAAAKAPGAEAMGQATQGMTDVQKTTENWRAILSIILSETLDSAGLAQLDAEAAKTLAQTSTAMTSLVLRKAATFAEEAKRDRVALEDIQAAYAELVGDWFEGAPKTEDRKQKTRSMNDAAFQVAREATLKNAEGKLQALSEYNHLKKAPSFDEAGKVAPYLSQLVGFPVSPDGAERLAEELRQFARLFLKEHGPQRSDTFSNYQEIPDEPGEKRLVSLAHVFNAVQDLFPTRRMANADAEVLMTRNVIPEEGGPSVIDERRVQLVAPSLDAVRDTGIHWLSLSKALEDEPHVALDPFAAELLVETLSEYAFFLLKGGVQGAVKMRQNAVTAAVVERLPWKFPLGRFFPVEDPHADPEDSLAEAPKPEHPPVFSERALPSSVVGDAAKNCSAKRTGFQAFMGSGVAIGDFNEDGKPDLFVASDGCNRLLQNDGNFQFSDVTDRMGISGLDATSRHPIFADVDGDGALDLFVTQSHAPSKLFMQKDGKFVDRTSAFGIKTGTAAHNAHFFDYDGDGDLDLFVGHYGKSKGDVATPTLDGRNGHPNQLWRNENGTHFTDVSEKAGVASTGWNLASAAVDIDRDGRLDFWLANDFGRDQVYHNKGNGTFEEIAGALRTDDRGSGMNVSIMDLTRDTRPDVFVSMIEMFSKTLRFVLPRDDSQFEVDDRVLASSYYISGMKLFTADEKPSTGSKLPFSFTDASRKYIDTGRKGWAWGAVFFDYDNDSDVDMYLANGWIQKSAFFEQYNQFMINHDGRLVTLGPQAAARAPEDGGPVPGTETSSALGYSGSSRAVGAADLNGDGRLDVIVVDYQKGPRIFENKTRTTGQHLKVALQGGKKNTRGIGARIDVYVSGHKPMTRFVDAGADYLAQGETPASFGFPGGAALEKVVVTWANGKQTTVATPKPENGVLLVHEG